LQEKRLPLQECAISWIITSVLDLSPTIIEGEANVSNGFSIPPYGKEGGRTTTFIKSG